MNKEDKIAQATDVLAKALKSADIDEVVGALCAEHPDDKKDSEKEWKENLLASIKGKAPKAQKMEAFYNAASSNSPARSGSGRIRNVKAMSDGKLTGLYAEMRPYKDSDPEAYTRVYDEMDARGFTLA